MEKEIEEWKEFTTFLVLLQEELWCLLNRLFGGPQSWSERF
jgi:hypothetical protein